MNCPIATLLSVANPPCPKFREPSRSDTVVYRATDQPSQFNLRNASITLITGSLVQAVTHGNEGRFTFSEMFFHIAAIPRTTRLQPAMNLTSNWPFRRTIRLPDWKPSAWLQHFPFVRQTPGFSLVPLLSEYARRSGNSAVRDGGEEDRRRRFGQWLLVERSS